MVLDTRVGIVSVVVGVVGGFGTVVKARLNDEILAPSPPQRAVATFLLLEVLVVASGIKSISLSAASTQAGVPNREGNRLTSLTEKSSRSSWVKQTLHWPRSLRMQIFCS